MIVGRLRGVARLREAAVRVVKVDVDEPPAEWLERWTQVFMQGHDVDPVLLAGADRPLISAEAAEARARAFWPRSWAHRNATRARG